VTPAVVTFAEGSAGLAGTIAAALGAEVFACGSDGLEAGTLLPRLFREGRPILGICAAGILIRVLAPYLADKQAEPPVLAISRDGVSVVPLLGGHHGANRLARQVAEAIGGTAALTTASDIRFARGLDEPPAGWALGDPEGAKAAMAAALGGAAIALTGDAPWIAEAGYEISPQGSIKVRASERLDGDEGLVYRPQTLVAGIGAERGVAAGEVIELIEATLASANLSPRSLAALATIELKADETAFAAAAAYFDVPLRLFTAAELDEERDRLVHPSALVEAETGTPGVAEAAALKAGTLIVPKRKSARATCAIGRASAPIDAATFGRSRGALHVVGVGPGDRASRTGAAVDALGACTDWVGYGLYLDLVADLRFGHVEHRFALGNEEMRARAALELAASGKTVALICSGDAQIYAMAALVYELLEAEGARAVSANARRVEIAVHPGISAMQAASAAAGALLGHDFCAISLSDLLTPASVIRKRLDAACRGDFVTALYNPRSERRTALLAEAQAMFAASRPADTPVVVARDLGRPGQRVEVTTIAGFDPASVDMLTIVVIGASTSRILTRGSGERLAYTPRGYAGKVAPP